MIKRTQIRLSGRAEEPETNPWHHFRIEQLFYPISKPKMRFVRINGGALLLVNCEGEQCFSCYSWDDMKDTIYERCLPVHGYAETIEIRSDENV